MNSSEFAKDIFMETGNMYTYVYGLSWYSSYLIKQEIKPYIYDHLRPISTYSPCPVLQPHLWNINGY